MSAGRRDSLMGSRRGTGGASGAAEDFEESHEERMEGDCEDVDEEEDLGVSSDLLKRSISFWISGSTGSLGA
jgi:hypothetical protein